MAATSPQLDANTSARQDTPKRRQASTQCRHVSLKCGSIFVAAELFARTSAANGPSISDNRRRPRPHHRTHTAPSIEQLLLSRITRLCLGPSQLVNDARTITDSIPSPSSLPDASGANADCRAPLPLASRHHAPVGIPSAKPAPERAPPRVARSARRPIGAHGLATGLRQHRCTRL